MRKKPPCYKFGADCPKRKLLCHGHCEEFQKWKAEEEERKKAVDKFKETENLMYSQNAKKAQYKKLMGRK